MSLKEGCVSSSYFKEFIKVIFFSACSQLVVYDVFKTNLFLTVVEVLENFELVVQATPIISIWLQMFGF